MKKILFFIRSLNAGGAERQLVITANGLAKRGYKVTVLTFYSGGFYAEGLHNSKVELLSLAKKGRWDLLAFLLRLFKVLRQQSPDIVYSWLGIANILSVLMRRYCIPNTRIVWGVRSSNMDLEQYDWLSRWSYWLECRLARFADTTISNSYAGLKYATAHGFPVKNSIVIHNGIDTQRFRPDEEAGRRMRKEWGMANDTVLIGAVGRIDPMKGIPAFLEAAAIVKQQNLNVCVRFIWVGVGEAKYTKSMYELATKLGIDDVLLWAGLHTDMLAVYNAFDIASSSSYGEGFPNVIGEAMACGIPCVVTNVGDSALAVSDAGFVVPVRDAQALAIAWNKMLSLSNGEFDGLSKSARDRVANTFGIKVLIDKTEQALFLERG